VIVHGVNGNMLEKYYYIGSVVFVAICNITPYAAGQYGYYNGACWFNNPDPEVQFRWLVGSQSVWTLLMSTGEVVSFSVILGYMLRYQASHFHFLLAMKALFTDQRLIGADAEHTAVVEHIVQRASQASNRCIPQHHYPNWYAQTRCYNEGLFNSLRSLPPPLLLPEFHRLYPGHLAGQNPSLHRTGMPHPPIQSRLYLFCGKQWRLSLGVSLYHLYIYHSLTK
jgi:hypothetical protein